MPVILSGTITKETKAAILFDAVTAKGWLPKSKIEIREMSERKSTPSPAEISMPSWLAIEKGMS